MPKLTDEVHRLSEATPNADPTSDLASCLASRICHDLTNPVGAIANGLELLLLSGIGASPEIDLISESVASANARLRFFRLAYGAAGDQPVARPEVQRILSALSRGGRHAYDWQVEEDVPRVEVKAAFLLLQCLEAASPLGARLRVVREDGTWVVSAEGPRLRADLSAWSAFASPATAPEGASSVQFALLAGLLSTLGRPLVLGSGPNRLDGRF